MPTGHHQYSLAQVSGKVEAALRAGLSLDEIALVCRVPVSEVEGWRTIDERVDVLLRAGEDAAEAAGVPWNGLPPVPHEWFPTEEQFELLDGLGYLSVSSLHAGLERWLVVASEELDGRTPVEALLAGDDAAVADVLHGEIPEL